MKKKELNMEKYIDKSAPFEETRNAYDLHAKHVLTPSGQRYGKVKEVRLHESSHAFEGLVVSRGVFNKSQYIGKKYIQKITANAVLLGIEPASLYLGRKVVSSDGKLFGFVRDIKRIGQTHQIHSLTVRKSFLRKVTVPASRIDHMGDSVILKDTHQEARKHYAK